MNYLRIFAAATLILLFSTAFAQDQTDDSGTTAAVAVGPVMPAAPLPVVSSAASPQPANTISLNLKGMDILDVLKMFAPYGMNIVVGKNVSGRVTLFLKNVNVWDAFEIILLANDLAYEKTGSIIKVVTQRDYEMQYGQRSDEKKKARIVQLKYAKASDLAQSLNQIKSSVGKVVVDSGSNTIALVDIPERLEDMQEFIARTDLPLKTAVFDLDFAQAEKLSPKIQDILTKNVGSLRIDERTNKIAVTDYPERLEEVGRIIGAFDEKTMQVLIDSQIIEINPSREFKMGVDWDFWIKKNVRLISTLPASTANKLSIGTAASNEQVSHSGQYKGIIDLLQTIGDVKILSSPRIMAVNNQEARILVGTKQPYASQTTVTGEGGVVTTSETINYVDVGIKLYVTPTINRDGFISMKIRPEVSSTGTPLVTAEGEQIPVVSTSEAETSVVIKDGVTIIIGGLTKQSLNRSENRIPFFGAIPVIGHFFKWSDDSRSKTDLVILLTPHIMSGEVSVNDFGQLQTRDGAQMKFDGDNLVLQKISSPAGDGWKDSTPEEYYRFVVDKVKAEAAFNNPSREKGTVRVTFCLDGQGKLAEEPVIDSSSSPGLIPVAVKAIRSAAPFPSFPASIKKERETFKAELAFE